MPWIPRIRLKDGPTGTTAVTVPISTVPTAVTDSFSTAPTVSKIVTVEPNTTTSVQVLGRYFYCRAATAPFVLRLGGGEAVSMDAGRQASHSGFTYLTITNESSATNGIEFVVSGEPINETRPTTANVITTAKDPQTYTKATACPDNATTTFNGLDGTNQRKQLIVQNREKTVADGGTGQLVEVSDNANTSGVRLQVSPGQMLTLVSNGIFKVTVPAGCTPAVALETFYSA